MLYFKDLVKNFKKIGIVSYFVKLNIKNLLNYLYKINKNIKLLLYLLVNFYNLFNKNIKLQFCDAWVFHLKDGEMVCSELCA